MDLGLSEIQKMLQQSSREFLEENCSMQFIRAMESDPIGVTDELWKNFAELGWLGLMIPEQYGGSGFEYQDMSILLEEMGRVSLSGPFFSTSIIAVQTILSAGNETQKSELLPKIASGDLKFSLSFFEKSGNIYPSEIQTTTARKQDEGWVINGEKSFVTDAASSDYFIVAAKTMDSEQQGISLFLVPRDKEGVEITEMKSVGGEKLSKVNFQEIKIEDSQLLSDENLSWNVLSKVFQLGASGKSSEMAGAATKILEITIDYVKNREQFNRPIGSFQAVQHQCADMAIMSKLCTQFARKSAWYLSNQEKNALEVHRSKAYVSKSFHDICQISHQLHGAIGYTWDYNLQIYTRKMQHQKLAFGDYNYHHKKISELLNLI